MSIKEDLKKAEELLEKDVTYLPTPLTKKHINLMNREIVKRSHVGYELEGYELLETAHFDRVQGVFQKFFSGVLFTWVKRTDHSSSGIQNKKDKKLLMIEKKK